jgi:pimeloyl-ACP methyl ester carboxylesterase
MPRGPGRPWRHASPRRVFERLFRTCAAPATRAFCRRETVRDGSGVALAQDVIDLADVLGIDRFDVVGHDWGARAAYTLAALFPGRIGRIAGLALAFQPKGAFELPHFSQARKFWYQWFMALDAAPAAVAADPKGFARLQWDTWSPPGWFDDEEFALTAAAFDNPDWVPITLNGYRRRWRQGEVSDPAYAALREKLATHRPALDTHADDPGRRRFLRRTGFIGRDGRAFHGGYRRVVLDGVGHFPPREAPDAVADLVIAHLRGE